MGSSENFSQKQLAHRKRRFQTWSAGVWGSRRKIFYNKKFVNPVVSSYTYEQRHSSWMQPLFPSHDICPGASEEDPEDTVVLQTGGQANNRRLSSIETFPTVPSCTLPPLPRARAGHSTFVTTGPKQNVVVCGGFDGEYTSSCLVLDLENQRWNSNKIGQLPQARMSHSAVSEPWKSVIDRGQWQKKVSLTGCILSCN